MIETHFVMGFALPHIKVVLIIRIFLFCILIQYALLPLLQIEEELRTWRRNLLPLPICTCLLSSTCKATSINLSSIYGTSAVYPREPNLKKTFLAQLEPTRFHHQHNATSYLFTPNDRSYFSLWLLNGALEVPAINFLLNAHFQLFSILITLLYIEGSHGFILIECVLPLAEVIRLQW